MRVGAIDFVFVDFVMFLINGVESECNIDVQETSVRRPEGVRRYRRDGWIYSTLCIERRLCK